MSYVDAINAITTATIAWNEVWMDYPDHWQKVYGNLLMACEEMDDYPELKEEVEAQAAHFYTSYTQGEKYRPPFEQIANKLLNIAVGQDVVSESATVSGSLCLDCAIKHVSEALVSWNSPDENLSWASVIGNLSHASNHLVEDYPIIANFIRSERSEFFESLDSPPEETMTYRPDFERMLGEITALAEDENA